MVLWRSSGLLNPTRDGALSLDAAFAMLRRKPGILAVSMEPAGGSTTGLPTGPMMFKNISYESRTELDRGDGQRE